MIVLLMRQDNVLHFQLFNCRINKTLNTPEPGKGWAADRDYIYDRNEGDSITASHSINLYLRSCPDLQLNGKNTVVTADADVIYSGLPVSPQVTVTYNGGVLSPDYYTVSGNSRTDVGEYTLTVTGKNGYSGSVTGSWRIVDPANVDLAGLHTALDRANALDAAAYVDFSGVTAAVDAALDALADTETLTQARVDALAAEIRIAIARLTAKTVTGGAAASVEGNHHYPNKPEAPTDTLKLNGVRISKDSGDAGRIAYKFTKMDFTALPTFYALVKVTGTGNHKYAENEIYTYQKVTLVPSKNVFFDDAVEAIVYTNSANVDSGYGVWSRITDNGSITTDAVDSFGDLETAQADTEHSVRYSFGDAHQVSVSDSLGKQWPKAQFTFTGSGFDVISVTDSSSGVFTVNVYQGTEAGAGKPFRTAIVDNYYGYRYTQLFYDRGARRFVDADDANGTVLYAALPTTPEESRVYSGLGAFFYTMDTAYAARDEQDSPVVAYGWIQSGSSDVLYQVPCLNLDLGTVGTYTVVIEPRFTASYGHYNESGGVRYYNFTLDGVRIYNPADGSNEALALYEENGEKYTAYELIRKTIPDEELVLIDGMEQIDKENIPVYLAGAPNNELYLRANGTAAFDVNFTGLNDARIGLKAANGTGCSVTISNGKTAKTVPVASATEQYVSVGDLLTPGETATLTVTNNGEGILSITRLMTATNASPSTQSGAPKRTFSVGPKTAKAALAAVAMLNADLTIDEETIGTTAAEDGTVTLTLKTSDAAQTVVIRDAEGRVVDPESVTFSVDETGVKNWTIVLSEEQSGAYTYTLQAAYENGYAPEQPTVVTVTVSLPESGAGEPESAGPEGPEDGETGSGSRLLRQIRGIFERLRELIRKILALFR